MKNSHFRTLLLATLLSYILGGILEIFWFERFLPPALQAYLQSQEEALTTLQIITKGMIAFLLLSCFILSIVGLWRFRPWAPKLFLAQWIAGCLLTVDFQPLVISGPGVFLASLTSLLDGLLIGILFFTPLRARFRFSGSQCPS
ncbi:hypothetical protein [Desulfobotulus sp.]|uniref:hypothetical protein n=1 Tax=Desulfobotulus sp. TaxID=1940337 RepID=UPI002A363AC1|nr:hypothetical protein [Desulfobotulus sp.]MDY0163231.1 hypothetical protein [Desulfobotulus sp.]